MEITVNGELIPAAVCRHEIARLTREFPNTETADITEMARRNLIDQILIAQEAERRFETIPRDDIDAEFKKLVDQHGGYDAFYRQFNLTEKDNARIKKDIARQIKVRNLLDELTTDVPLPKESDIRAFYDEHQQEFVEPQQIHAAHIVRQPTPQDAAQIFAELKDIRRQLLDGAEFSELADEHSSCEDSGGDLGFFPPGKMVEEFDVVAFSMNPGEVSPIFRTQFGYHIVKVYETRPPRELSFEEAADRISDRLHYDMKNEHIGMWVDTQKDAAEITITEDTPKSREPLPFSSSKQSGTTPDQS